MISELTDEEILEYLMTSDIIENFRPDEYKYLIFSKKCEFTSTKDFYVAQKQCHCYIAQVRVRRI